MIRQVMEFDELIRPPPDFCLAPTPPHAGSSFERFVPKGQQILKRPGCWEMTGQIFSWQNSRVSNRNLLNLRNLWLNPFLVFGFKVQTEMVRLHRTALVSCASLILTPMG